MIKRDTSIQYLLLQGRQPVDTEPCQRLVLFYLKWAYNIMLNADIFFVVF